VLQLKVKMRSAGWRVIVRALTIWACSSHPYTVAGIATAANDALKLVGIDRDWVTCLHTQDAHVAVDGAESIGVINAHMEAVAGPVIRRGPPSLGNCSRRSGANQVVSKRVIYATMLVVAAASAWAVSSPVVMHRPGVPIRVRVVLSRNQWKFMVED
jgi:hypothetical protein